MPKKNSVSAPDPGRFNLTSFADILPRRDPIVGEDPGSFSMFHAGMTQSLAPATPYECVVAESLICIEWELLQLRRMRDAALRETIREQICEAFVIAHETIHQHFLTQNLEDHLSGGGTKEDWEPPEDFDADAAEEAGQDLATRASSHDPQVQAEAYEEIEALGITPLDLMLMAYHGERDSLDDQDARIRDREQRRHEMMRDFDRLQSARRIASAVEDAEVIEAEVIEAETSPETKAVQRSTRTPRARAAKATGARKT